MRVLHSHPHKYTSPPFSRHIPPHTSSLTNVGLPHVRTWAVFGIYMLRTCETLSRGASYPVVNTWTPVLFTSRRFCFSFSVKPLLLRFQAGPFFLVFNLRFCLPVFSQHFAPSFSIKLLLPHFQWRFRSSVFSEEISLPFLVMTFLTPFSVKPSLPSFQRSLFFPVFVEVI